MRAQRAGAQQPEGRGGGRVFGTRSAGRHHQRTEKKRAQSGEEQREIVLLLEITQLPLLRLQPNSLHRVDERDQNRLQRVRRTRAVELGAAVESVGEDRDRLGG